MGHTQGKPYHPQTQGKIEHWHRSLKNQILLDHYYLPRQLEDRIRQSDGDYNHECYHESLDNLTPADVFYGRGKEILNRRQQIKMRTLALPKQMHYDNRPKLHNLMSQIVS